MGKKRNVKTMAGFSGIPIGIVWAVACGAGERLEGS